MSRWLFYSIVTMALWGGWGVLSKPAAKLASPWQVQAFSTLGFLPALAALLLLPDSRAVRDWKAGFGWGFMSGAVGSLGNIAYFKALGAGGKAAAVIPLTALYPIVTVLLATILLHEHLNFIQSIGILLSLAAIACFNFGSGTEVVNAWVAIAMLPIGFWGLSALLQKLSSNCVSAPLAAGAFLVGELPMALLTPVFVPMDWRLPPVHWLILTGLGLLFGLGNLTLILAFSHGGKASVVTTLASLYSVVTIPLALLLLHETISWQESIGIGLALFAAAALCWETAPDGTAGNVSST